ncbi:MAG: hypothetical protein ABJN62_13120 [Halioglobus sp.]
MRKKVVEEILSDIDAIQKVGGQEELELRLSIFIKFAMVADLNEFVSSSSNRLESYEFVDRLIKKIKGARV